MVENARAGILDQALQKRLDYLDWLIAELEREKPKATILPEDIDNAKQMQQAARESYNRRDFERAWLQAITAEYEVLIEGQIELQSWNRLVSDIRRMLDEREF